MIPIPSGEADSFPTLDDEAFLTRAYLLLIGRPPDAFGERAYMERLCRGETRATVWTEIANSGEAQAFAAIHHNLTAAPTYPIVMVESVDDLLRMEGADFVSQAYRSILGRDADATGLREYATRLKTGLDKRQLIADMRCDPEGQGYAAQLPGVDDLVREVQAAGPKPKSSTNLRSLLNLEGQEFIDAAYGALFRRNPDSSGAARYLELLSAGRSKLLILKLLLESPEAAEKHSHIPGLSKKLWLYDLSQQGGWRGAVYRTIFRMRKDSDLG